MVGFDGRNIHFDEPTRGIDVEAKAAIHEMIRNWRDGVLLYS